MNGSDVLTGGTWFLKDLFYGSILIAGLASGLKHITKIKFNTIIKLIFVCCFFMAIALSYYNIHIKYFSWILSSDMFLSASMISFGYIFKNHIINIYLVKESK